MAHTAHNVCGWPIREQDRSDAAVGPRNCEARRRFEVRVRRKGPGRAPGPDCWWRRRESNSRPQALRYRFYVRVQPIDLAACYPVGGENTKPATERFSGSSPEHTGSAIL